MFLDTAASPITRDLHTGVAIVGSGPAGLTVARKLAEHGVDAIVLESGERDYSDAAQELNAGIDTRGRDAYLETGRIRAFGGTSYHWGGWCRPLDPVDFNRREWIADSGWPITFGEVEAHYAEAARICDLDGADFAVGRWEQTRGQPALRFADGEFDSAYFQLSPPTRFADKYGAAVEASDRLTVILNATVTRIDLNPDGQRCERLTVAQRDGEPFHVVAQHYVVACGGIENARLLLLSNDVADAGVGNQNDLVGRFFMDHVGFTSGALLTVDPNQDVGLYIYDSHPDTRGFAVLVPGESMETELRLPRFNIELFPKFIGSRQHYQNLKEEYWRLAWSIKDDGVFDNFGYNIARFLAMVGEGTSYAWRELFGPENELTGVSLRHHLECLPQPSSRVSLLADQTDRLGQPVVHLDWRVDGTMFDSWHTAQQRLALAVGKSGIGRLRIDYDPAQGPESVDYTGGWHHMGTTRMADAPSRGVVDRNCRVFGVDNLFIAGSSVFATSGHANPTLTIVALALRLADHVTERMGKP